MKFTVTMEITHKADRGDTIVSGNAEVEWVEGNRGQVRRVTAGDRLTAAEKRGGVTLTDAEDALAGRLGILACRAVR